MAFNELTLEKLGLSSTELTGGFSCTVLGGLGIHIEGHKSIFYMSETEVVFRVKRGTITVFGEGLKLRELSTYDAYLKGKITGVEIVENE